MSDESPIAPAVHALHEAMVCIGGIDMSNQQDAADVMRAASLVSRAKIGGLCEAKYHF